MRLLIITHTNYTSVVSDMICMMSCIENVGGWLMICTLINEHFVSVLRHAFRNVRGCCTLRLIFCTVLYITTRVVSMSLMVLLVSGSFSLLAKFEPLSHSLSLRFGEFPERLNREM